MGNVPKGVANGTIDARFPHLTELFTSNYAEVKVNKRELLL